MASSGKGAFKVTVQDRREEQGVAMAQGKFLLSIGGKRENEQRTTPAQLRGPTGSSHRITK